MLSNYKIILWDFDGVIMDSMPIRDLGFQEVLKNFPKDQIDELLKYHNLNGGLSRYVKFRYFFEQIRKESITEQSVNDLANDFSKVMLLMLINKELLIDDSINFIINNHHRYPMHIVSGSDGNELNHICSELNLSQYFKSIQGSPTPKKQLVSSIINQNNYNKHDIVLIGDSINDKEAAEYNGISFIGYNNPALNDKDYINSFSDLQL